MSKNIPIITRDKVRQAVYEMADSRDYSNNSRHKNGILMDEMVNVPTIGGVLKSFMNKSEVKTYIKDAILNRYQKDKKRSSFPDDIIRYVNDRSGRSLLDIECNSDMDVKVCRDASYKNRWVIISKGTYLKWETALRKCLLVAARLNFPDENSTCEFIILLTSGGKVVPSAESDHLMKALGFASASAMFV